MEFAWRSRSNHFALLVVCSVTFSCGCQTWSPSNWGVPAGTRVPPPPTGSYQHQGAYYNNPATGATSAAPAAALKSTTQNFPSTAATNGAVVQASANGSSYSASPSSNAAAFSSRLTTASGNNGAASIGMQDINGQVNTADYTDNGSGMAQVVNASSVQSPRLDPYSASGNIDANSNTANAGAVDLKWK